MTAPFASHVRTRTELGVRELARRRQHAGAVGGPSFDSAVTDTKRSFTVNGKVTVKSPLEPVIEKPVQVATLAASAAWLLKQRESCPAPSRTSAFVQPPELRSCCAFPVALTATFEPLSRVVRPITVAAPWTWTPPLARTSNSFDPVEEKSAFVESAQTNDPLSPGRTF